MKKYIIIIFVSENGFFIYKKSPLDNGDVDYREYFRALTGSYPIILGENAYAALREKSPPFAGRNVCMIEGDIITIDTGDTAEKIIVLADKQLYGEFISSRQEEVDHIVEVTVPCTKDEGEAYVPPPQMDWFPAIKGGGEADQSPIAGHVIKLHYYNPFMM